MLLFEDKIGVLAKSVSYSEQLLALSREPIYQRKLFQLSTAECQLQNPGITEKNQYLLIFSDIQVFKKITLIILSLRIFLGKCLKNTIFKITIQNHLGESLQDAIRRQGPAPVSVPFPSPLLNKHDEHTRTTEKVRQTTVSVHLLMQTVAEDEENKTTYFKSQTRPQDTSHCYDPVECKLGIG